MWAGIWNQVFQHKAIFSLSESQTTKQVVKYHPKYAYQTVTEEPSTTTTKTPKTSKPSKSETSKPPLALSTKKPIVKYVYRLTGSHGRYNIQPNSN